MSWHEREYQQESAGWRRRELWGILLPPRASLWLIGLHTVTFFIMLFLWASAARPSGGAAIVQNHDSLAPFLQFSGTAAQPLGILLHPFLNRSFASLLLIVLMTWSVAGRLESRYGPGRMLKLYFVGNLMAGLVYFGVARWQPPFAGYALDLPVGALAAWSVAVWLDFKDELVVVFGSVQNTSKITAITGLVIAGLVLLINGHTASAWLLAAAAGGCAVPVLERLPSWKIPQPRQVLRRRASQPAIRPSIPKLALNLPLEPESEAEPDPFDIDAILAKISREGIQSLTQKERDQLEAARQAKLKHSARVES